MMRKERVLPLLAALFIIFSICAPIASAATGAPKLLNYQGRLMDSAGNLLGGSGTNYCFQFSLYDSQLVGTGTKLWPVGTPSTMTIPVKGGVFNASVGDTNAGGDLLTYNFQDSDSVYLNVDVATKVGATCASGDGAEVYESLSPRQRLQSSAYALNSNTVGGYTPAQNASGNQLPVLSGGNLILGGVNPIISATTTNALTIQGSSSGNINFFNTSNHLDSAGNLTLSGSIFSGNGIATSTIQSDIAGTSTLQGFLNVLGTNSTSTFAGGLSVNRLNVAGTATSTFAGGISLSGGCFAVNGTCLNFIDTSFSTTSADFYVNASTTIPKTYTSNSFTATQTFINASTTNFSASYASSTQGYFGSLFVGTLTGVLHAAGGAVSAAAVNLASEVSGFLGIANGGTGTSTPPTLGKVLVGNALGGYDYVATSTFGAAVDGTFSTTSADFYTNGSSTIAKTYTANVFNALQTFNTFLGTAGTTTNFAITGTANTLLKTNASGAVVPALAGVDYQVAGNYSTFAYPFTNNGTSTQIAFNGGATFAGATTSALFVNGSTTIAGILNLGVALTIANGGTGTSTAPGLGKVLVGNAFGGYDYVATSTFGSGAIADGNFSTTSADYYITASSTIPKTSIANFFSATQTFTYASTTLLSIANGTATTTLQGSATSTFGAGVQATALRITGAATSSFANGINVTSGCFSVNGTCIAGNGQAGNTGTLVNIQTFSASGTFTYVPSAGVTSAQVIVTGGGGGGGDGNGVATLGGSGGAGGTSISFVDLTATSSVQVTVGGGGAGTRTTSGNGGNGGVSRFSTFAIANGGGGGQGGTNGNGGLGATAGTGNIALPGGMGSKGATALASEGQLGGASYWGGGAGVQATSTVPGAGGGSATSTISSGAGGTGIVVVYEYGPFNGVQTIANGGTGVSTLPNYGQILVGNGSGGYTLLATSSLGLPGFSTSSADFYVNASTTIAKTYASNIFTALQTFANFIGVNGTTTSLAITGVPSGLLSTNANGSVVATTSLSTNYFTQASLSQSGFLSNTDYSIFSSKLASSSIQNSAALASLISDEMGTGVVVFNNNATLSSTTLSGNTLLSAATTTSFAISNISGQLLKTLSNGAVVAAVAGTDYQAPGNYATFAYPFPNNATSTQIAFNGGATFTGATTTALFVNGSTTIAGILNLGSALTISNGGTGTTTAPGFGKVLVGNALGGYDYVATSTFGAAADGNFSTTSADYYITASSTIPKTTLANFFTAKQTFTYASTTLLSIANGTATTTLQGNATSTFGAGVQTTALQVTGPAMLSSALTVGGLTVLNNASSTVFSSNYASSTQGFFGSVNIGNLTGLLRATAGAITTATVNLASDVGSSILSVTNGGTGWANLAAGTILVGNGSGSVATTTVGGTLVNSGGALDIDLGNVNTWTGLQAFGNASTTLLESVTQMARTIQSTSTNALVIKTNLTSTQGLTIGSTSTPRMLTFDTQNNRVVVGTGAGVALPILTVLDYGNSSDPAGVNGAEYYNSSTFQFRCFANGAWRTCDGQAASSTGAVQFTNPDGSFGGDADFSWSSANHGLTVIGNAGQTAPLLSVASSTGQVMFSVTGNGLITLSSTTEPTTPSSGTVDIYAKDIAGRIIPKWIGPAGVDTPFQANFGFNRIAMSMPASNATTTQFGTMSIATGTVATPNLASTNLLTSVRRTTYSTTAIAGALAGQRQIAGMAWRGNAAGIGGFFFTTRFTTSATTTNNRAFVGLTDSLVTPTNVDPTTSTTGNKIGMAINAATGNWKIIWNTNAVAPTVFDLGSGFPVLATNLYELVLFSAPNGSTIGYRVTNITTGAQFASSTGTTNLPLNTAFMAPQFWITNNATAAVVTLDNAGWYLESDN